MKYNKVSFIIHLCNIIVFAFSFSLSAKAQTSSDNSIYYRNAIVNPTEPNDLPSGIHFFTKKKDKDLELNDTLNAIYDLRLLSIAEFKIGNNFNSENHAVEALNIIESMGTKDTLIDSRVGLYNQLGRIYRTSNNPTEAIRTFDKALEIANKLKDSVIILNNKANVYKDELDYIKALDIYTLLHKKQAQLNTYELALVADNLGQVQSKLNLPEGLQNLKNALELREKNNDFIGQHSSNTHLAEFYLDKKDTTIAKMYAEKALALSGKINSSSFKLEAISTLMNMDRNPLLHEYKKLTDSITNAKQIAENKNAFLKYNVAEEQKKTQASILLQEIESRKRLAYQSLAFIIFLILVGSYFIYRNRYRKAKIEEIYKTETRIAKKVHDEVANDMYKVMTSLENNSGVDSNVIDEMEKIYTKTRDISRENSAIDLRNDFDLQLNDLLLGYKNNKVNVITRNLSKMPWNTVTEHKKTAIYRVLQELMTNMRKHSKASFVTLIFKKEGSKIQIIYRDNGVGCDLFKKNGLQHTESRIASLNGTINFESKQGDGFKASIII
ncbi:Tetratricopeptide repeat-containing protein [Maribacter aquivivus]|uniref:Tetratricopeptide repeat-containing protein n=1 Tax=Maribacter aquivivus TaxID=228958 RepID=A0A1M6IUX0_9FLAO|nr:tetratricopeptide repeat-containing sensor histidine kinase [Maribacter aquivivus]SHJ38246.1 Tetratricopeptide repeat-containing protein [Maribacter aquivivus]